MTTPVRPDWIESLRRLHPLLKAPPPVSDWAARQAKIDLASKADAEAAGRSREEAARRRERTYNNEAATWAGFAIVAVILVLGLFIVFRLIDESRLEDCLLAHRHNCDALLDR